MPDLCRSGWAVREEPRPSLNKHFMPVEGYHCMALNCHCKPKVVGMPESGHVHFSLVVHNE